VKAVTIRNCALAALALVAAACGQEGPGETATGCRLATGYAGDDSCILPPDPTVGFQLHYGPTRYDDPTAVAEFLLAPGQEATDCVYVKTPNATSVFTHEYHARMRPNSHHLVLFGLDEAADDGHRACGLGAKSRYLAGAQSVRLDIPDPTQAQAPEDDGAAMLLLASTQVALQLHFINTTDHPILREAWVNFVYSSPDEVKLLIDPIFFIGGLGMNIPPGTKTLIEGTATAPRDLRVMMLTGHRHAHASRFSAWKVADGERTLIYEDYSWHDPLVLNLNSVVHNPVADAAMATSGGASGDLFLHAGDRIDWECDVDNDTNAPLKFANEVFTAEMCNLFGYVAPGNGGTWTSLNY
jgi:hypothetical protein